MPVPDFSPGEVLTAAAMDSIGLWLVKTVTIGTGVSSVTVTDAFSANYDNYKIVINGGANSTQASLGMQLGASVTGYSSILNYGVFSALTTPQLAGNNNSASWGFVGYATTNSLFASFDLLNPFNTKFTSHMNSGWPAETAAGTATGIHQVAASYTGFTIFPINGTMTGGTIRVYGYRN